MEQEMIEWLARIKETPKLLDELETFLLEQPLPQMKKFLKLVQLEEKRNKQNISLHAEDFYRAAHMHCSFPMMVKDIYSLLLGVDASNFIDNQLLTSYVHTSVEFLEENIVMCVVVNSQGMPLRPFSNLGEFLESRSTYVSSAFGKSIRKIEMSYPTFVAYLFNFLRVYAQTASNNIKVNAKNKNYLTDDMLAFVKKEKELLVKLGFYGGENIKYINGTDQHKYLHFIPYTENLTFEGTEKVKICLNRGKTYSPNFEYIDNETHETLYRITKDYVIHLDTEWDGQNFVVNTCHVIEVKFGGTLLDSETYKEVGKHERMSEFLTKLLKGKSTKELVTQDVYRLLYKNYLVQSAHTHEEQEYLRNNVDLPN